MFFSFIKWDKTSIILLIILIEFSWVLAHLFIINNFWLILTLIFFIISSEFFNQLQYTKNRILLWWLLFFHILIYWNFLNFLLHNLFYLCLLFNLNQLFIWYETLINLIYRQRLQKSKLYEALILFTLHLVLFFVLRIFNNFPITI